MDKNDEGHFLLRTPSKDPSYKEKYKKEGKFVLHYFSDKAISEESNYSFGIRPVIQININKPNE